MAEPNQLPPSWRDIDAKWGIVLGSGLGGIAERFEVLDRLSYASVSGLPRSTVPGHAGDFLLLRIGRTAVIAAKGRVHLYEGHSAAGVTAGVRFLAGLGIKHLVLTNAAGSLNPGHPPGDWMILTDHLNLTGTSPLIGAPSFHDMSHVYSADLRERFLGAAHAEGVKLHSGIYAGLLGPQYETPAEVRMLRGFGADAVGMSTVLEAIQAHALGIKVAGFSCLTNWAAGVGKTPLSHTEVLSVGQAAADQFYQFFSRAINA